MEVKVKDLKAILERALNELQYYEDEESVRAETSSFRLNHFLALGHLGFVDLDNNEIIDKD